MTNRLAAVLCFLFAPAVFALNSRSAVSANGLDTNSCTPAAPCRSFTTAIAQTASGGEIIALDSAGYGPFTIGSAVAIFGAPGAHAAITATSGSAITISATQDIDEVILRNLVLIGAGGAVGVDQIHAGEVRIFNCLIRGFGSAGIRAVDSGNVSVDHTTILDNASGDAMNPAKGITIIGASGGFIRYATITDCVLSRNDVGIHADSETRVTVADTAITGSPVRGVEALSCCFNDTAVVLKSCTVAYNACGVFADGLTNAFASIFLSQNVVALNDVGAAMPGIAGHEGSALYSNGDNRFETNGSDGGPFQAAPNK